MINWKNIEQQLINFLKEQLALTKLENVTVGLSGGLDSAVVAILCKKAFGDNMSCVLMPSQFSSQSSIDDAKKLCEKFDIKYEIVNISPMIDAYINNMNNDKLRIGNYSARVRMSVLYDISSRDDSIVVGTSNKSELLLGYGTIFGDIACAINPIGQIYKSDEFEFAKYLGVIEEIISKKPSADLWEGQTDEGELGYTYKQMDDVLKLLVDENKSKEEIVVLGHDGNLVDMLKYRIKANEFKGKLPVIANIKWS
ncbi:NAD(+) synthetase [Malaciobacter mytili LMG 24559]|uniref:NH(3)-dependent NAD(+) synthetase n=1 Tax=Malaciobacter mytili LMG 24559 TaxID=1032238 RepID=A0AAX2AIA0_9BACT|nr:NAD+ synthase [Malaciobacter mytili]AXH15195.1 NAD synthetase, NH3-dependent [Malaciobacter mytili LMG 24559]RXK15236.1 NAD(+) synthetase [Malaciobacter mytili LMG 24559]